MKLAVVYYDGNQTLVRLVERFGPYGMSPDELSAYAAEDITAVVQVPDNTERVWLSEDGPTVVVLFDQAAENDEVLPLEYCPAADL